MVARIRLASLPALGMNGRDLRVQVGRRHVRFDEVLQSKATLFHVPQVMNTVCFRLAAIATKGLFSKMS